jgi:hypothetical protein
MPTKGFVGLYLYFYKDTRKNNWLCIIYFLGFMRIIVFDVRIQSIRDCFVTTICWKLTKIVTLRYVFYIFALNIWLLWGYLMLV